MARRKLLASALGLALGIPATLPAAEPSPNQHLANAIVSHLRASGRLRHYNVEVTVRANVVELEGSVASQGQREEVLRLIQGVPGVERVRDRMTVAEAGSQVVPAQGPEVNPAVPPPPPGRLPDPLPPTGPTNPPHMPPAGPEGGIPEPTPMFRAPMPSHMALNPPRLPPYAWPTYAPYNNFSRVAYPTAYPYNSFPFIGPMYPFPKVPLGWRSVKLEWDDGYWWFGRVGNKYDWWKTRFW